MQKQIDKENYVLLAIKHATTTTTTTKPFPHKPGSATRVNFTN
jgi:hypothetical protein